MRNHLAEDVLDENMLNLLRCYQKSLHKGSDLDSVIEFLENTSKIIKFFRDPRPIVSMSDGRIHEIKQVLIWFQSWRDEVSRFESLTAKQIRGLSKNDVIHGATIRIVIWICTVSIIQSSLLAKDILSQVGVKSRRCQSLALIS
jgi:hypothetical protein